MYSVEISWLTLFIISNVCNAVEGHCLQTMKIVHHHANGCFHWLISGQKSVNPSREAIPVLSGKYKRFTFVHHVPNDWKDQACVWDASVSSFLGHVFLTFPTTAMPHYIIMWTCEIRCLGPLILKSDWFSSGQYFPLFWPVSVSLPVQSTNFDLTLHFMCLSWIKALLRDCLVNAKKYLDLSSSYGPLSVRTSELRSERFSAWPCNRLISA